MDSKGKVYLVGAGPGDPGLITEKGRKLLESCDVVIYDRLVSPKLISYTKPNCEKVYVGKEVGHHAIKQEEINQIIIEKALSATLVVRLKGGDPYVFGRGGEEVLALKEQGIDYEVIPGVTSSIAAATYAGIPITHRGASQSFHVITGHTAQEDTTVPEDVKSLAKLDGTLVILMGIGNLKLIREELLKNGRTKDTPVAVIENATTLWQREVRGTLEDICQRVKNVGIKAPAVIIIGDVAGMDLRSDQKRTLSGIRVVITGTKAIIDKLTEQLEQHGALVEAISTVEITEYQNNDAFETAMSSLKQYQWIVFTSTNSVQIFFNKMKELQLDYRRLGHIRFAVVGPGTAQALQKQGFQADFIPKQYSVTCLANQLSCQVDKGEKILIPRAQQGSEELINIFNTNQIAFDDIKIYDVKESFGYPKEWLDRLSYFDYLTFASSSGVHGFMKEMPDNLKEIPDNLKEIPDNLKEMFMNTRIVCIGEATECTLRGYGFEDIIVAKEASVTGLVESICDDYNKKTK